MARLKGSVSFQVEGFSLLAKIIPDVNGSFLAYIGRRGRLIMLEKYFSGQELDYDNLDIKKGFPVDKRGRAVIMSDVNKKQTFTKLSSYPVNFYERGRLLRSGRKEPAKRVITGKLKREISANMQKYATRYEERFIRKALKGINL